MFEKMSQMRLFGLGFGKFYSILLP